MATDPDERPTFPQILAELGPIEDDPILPDDGVNGGPTEGGVVDAPAA